jgi:hypothetical protein
MATRPLTPAEKAQRNPPFNTARMTATMTAPPPFSFPRTNLHYFPVPADLATLQQFCDNYLNTAPDFAWFRPAMPFVFVLVNYYPHMGYAAGNLGWISQNEVLIMVPLEWYEHTEEGYRFRDFAQFSPFAFVDKDLSEVEGREVYGWPKVAGWFVPSVSSWVEDPRARRTVLNLHTHGFQALYQNQYDKTLPLLRITQSAPPSFTVMPPEPGGVLDPLTGMARGMNDWNLVLRAGLGWMSSAVRSVLSGDTTPALLLDDLQRRIGAMTRLLMANTVNFKQIRDAEDPGMACYQAVTNARMEVTAFRRGGLLGDPAILRGDLSGGYELELCNYPSIPILQSLGLATSASAGDRSQGPGSVQTLRPVMPFWQELDLTYLTGENIAWRAWNGKEALWRNGEKIEVREQNEIAGATTGTGHEPRFFERPPYMTEAGAGFQVAEGPFSFPGANLEILPLKADFETLRGFLQDGPGDHDLDHGLPKDLVPHSLMAQIPRDICFFDPWGSYVYLVVAHYPVIESERNDFGRIQENQVMFVVPVKLCRETDHGTEVLTAGFIAPYMYSTNEIAATTQREVAGFMTMRAAIKSAPNSWLTGDGPLADRVPLLEVSAEMPAALFDGQEFAWRKLLKLVDGNPINADDALNWQTAAAFVREVKAHVGGMQTTQDEDPALFEQFLGLALGTYSGTPLNQFSFKQFRDTAHPNEACYQSLVCSEFVIDRVHHQEALENNLHVHLYRSPTQPIAQSLGLIVKSVHQDDDGVYDSLQPVRPLYLRADVHARHARNLTLRSGTRVWPPLDLNSLHRDEHSGASGLAARLMRDHPEMELLRDHRIQEWRRNRSDTAGCDGETCEKLLHGGFEPQMAINSVLSQEWGNHRAPRWSRQKERRQEVKKLKKELAALKARREPLRQRGDSAAEVGRISERVRALRRHIRYLKAFPVERLPDYVLRTDMAGPLQQDVFSRHENFADENRLQYWTPDISRWTTQPPDDAE